MNFHPGYQAIQAFNPSMLSAPGQSWSRPPCGGSQFVAPLDSLTLMRQRVEYWQVADDDSLDSMDDEDEEDSELDDKEYEEMRIELEMERVAKSSDFRFKLSSPEDVEAEIHPFFCLVIEAPEEYIHDIKQDRSREEKRRERDEKRMAWKSLPQNLNRCAVWKGESSD